MLSRNSNLRKGIFSAALITCLGFSSALADSAVSLKDQYAKYQAALKAGSKVDDIKPFLTKRVIEEMDKSAGPEKEMLFGLMKAMSPSSYKVTSEEVKGDSGLLKLSNNTETKNSTESTTGVIKFQKENGSWKIDKEDWNSKVTAN